jgi:phenylalanine-4-hydroxylase
MPALTSESMERTRRSIAELFIEQRYECYSAADHEAWRKLYARLKPRWEKYANERFLAGIEALGLNAERIPRLEEINQRLEPRTGFQAIAVSGYVPSFIFLDRLRNREFPATVTIRPSNQLDYLPEPDIFHDIAGHVPMHTDQRFADMLARLGECAHTAAALAAQMPPETRLKKLTSIVRAMARFFWFTVEFGLMKGRGGLRVYGSGLLSSYGEIEHAIESPEVQRYPIQLEWVINQSFEIDHYQPLLFVVESFSHLFELVEELDQWMREGRLDNVAPGEPETREGDLESFLQAGK